MDKLHVLEPMYDLYIFDDEENTQVYIAQTLANVLDMPPAIAVKLIRETEKKGRSLVDSCVKEEAITKRDLLISFGLTSEICKVDISDLMKP